ncbi:STAS/SEC14 domain-containing protein [Pseudorhodobacter sp.]|uniref:STAS/SEC14 domain-containing protein n=1 Tax=Pseudorhodobacter sp. TaxID=1934400 RepID=UPI0026474F0E|nr:STAS/SEC14 domain-containing protein [Pseudorhodobacter sp.]MDN5787674.1 STAS/SEC14 domain-containing protein [Pseudorhodobacter sp.]
MATTYRTLPQSKIFEFTVSGKVTSEDFDALSAPLDAFVKEHDKIKLLEIIESFHGFDPSLLWQGIKYDVKILPHITHCAVVSDMGWISPLTKAAGAFMATKLRTFDLSELDTARDWLAQA